MVVPAENNEKEIHSMRGTSRRRPPVVKQKVRPQSVAEEAAANLNFPSPDPDKHGPVDRFANLEVSEDLLSTLAGLGYEEPTPIQSQTLPAALDGHDMIGMAPTGTGKTAAFSIPIIEQLDLDAKSVQAIVLSPTRELTEQVAKEAERLAGKQGVRFVTLVGGRPLGSQERALERGVHIVVGTPGRVLDHISRGNLNLGDVRFVVLDEADRMLDFGFRPDIEKILKRCPTDRQTLLFSATMPPDVLRLVKNYQRNPLQVDLTPKNVSEQVTQYVCNVDHDRKRDTLARVLYKERPRQAIVFCRTKRGADNLHKVFSRKLGAVDVLHGDLRQTARDKVMKRFRAGKTRLLIATDIVGRGIDVSTVSHVINYDVPEDCDDYVHRVGRAGRISSDQKGYAFTFATREDGELLTRIEMRINKMLTEYKVDGFSMMRDVAAPKHVDDLEPKAVDVTPQVDDAPKEPDFGLDLFE